MEKFRGVLRVVVVVFGVVGCWGGSLGAAELFGSDTDSDTLVRIDSATGSYQVVGTFGFDVQGLAYAPELDQLFGLSSENRRVYRIDRSNGVATAVGAGPHLFGNANGLAYDSRRGRLVGVSLSEAGSDDRLLSIDPVTGAYADLGRVSGARDVEGLGYDPASDRLFGLADREDRIVAIDPATGNSTTVVQLPAMNWRGLEYDAFGGVFYASVSFGGQLYEVRPGATPEVRFIGVTSVATQGLAVVPEPGFLAWVGGAGVVLLRRCRRM
jgi:hypothetical protein